MKTINVRLGDNGMNHLIKTFDKYVKDFDKKCSAMVMAIAERGQKLIETTTEGAIIDRYAKIGKGNPFVEDAGTFLVSVDHDGLTAVIDVTGNGLYYAEFGTGVHYNGAVGSGAYPKAVELGYTIGSNSFSGSPAKQYWRFSKNGEPSISFGVKAQMPVYTGTQDLISEIAEIVRGVWQE